MDRSTFAERLHTASVAARDFARSFVLETLPDEMLFRVRLNQSYDGNPLHPDERVYSEDGALNLIEKLALCTEAEVVDLLWRENRVPEWLDIAVVGETGSETIMGLLCCGRFTANDQLLYHKKEGWPPFHAVGPALPPNHQNGQRFSIYTRCQAFKFTDIQALKPHSDKVWSLQLIGPACDDLTLSNLPKFPAMQVLDLAYTGASGTGLRALDGQPKLRVLKVFVRHPQPFDLKGLPRLPLLNTLMVNNAPPLNFDFGKAFPKLPKLNHLDLHSSGPLALDGRLPHSMWAVRLRGQNIAGALKCPKNVEHLSLQFTETNEGALANLVRHTDGVKFLNLSMTPISDGFLENLVSRWPLEYLEISGTKVSEEFAAQLVRRHPEIRVFHRQNITNGGSVPSLSAS